MNHSVLLKKNRYIIIDRNYRLLTSDNSINTTLIFNQYYHSSDITEWENHMFMNEDNQSILK